MDEEVRPGYYKDENGVWRKDRRRAPDRRNRQLDFHHHDRRTYFRRKTDLIIKEREAKIEIEEALKDLEEKHGAE